jgi:hypothetical protein
LLVYDRLDSTWFTHPFDWESPELEPLVDQQFVMPRGGGEVKVTLGGSSITGMIPSEVSCRWPGVDPVEVIAVMNGDRKYTRRGRSYPDGSFRVRYLFPGTYSLYVYGSTLGFCLIDRVNVSTGTVNVGVVKLTSGATVFGTVEFPRLARVPDQVVAVAPSGVSVRQLFETHSSFDHFEFGDLWPGRWVFAIRSGNDTLATSEVDVSGTGLHSVVMIPDGARAR